MTADGTLISKGALPLVFDWCLLVVSPLLGGFSVPDFTDRAAVPSSLLLAFTCFERNADSSGERHLVSEAGSATPEPSDGGNQLVGILQATREYLTFVYRPLSPFFQPSSGQLPTPHFHFVSRPSRAGRLSPMTSRQCSARSAISVSRRAISVSRSSPVAERLAVNARPYIAEPTRRSVCRAVARRHAAA